METRNINKVNPEKLNGNRHIFEAVRQALPLAFAEAYRMAKAYSTDLVSDYEGKTIYLNPEKYSLDDIRDGVWKDDPGIFTPRTAH